MDLVSFQLKVEESDVFRQLFPYLNSQLDLSCPCMYHHITFHVSMQNQQYLKCSGLKIQQNVAKGDILCTETNHVSLDLKRYKELSALTIEIFATAALYRRKQFYCIYLSFVLLQDSVLRGTTFGIQCVPGTCTCTVMHIR